MYHWTGKCCHKIHWLSFMLGCPNLYEKSDNTYVQLQAHETNTLGMYHSSSIGQYETLCTVERPTISMLGEEPKVSGVSVSYVHNCSITLEYSHSPGSKDKLSAVIFSMTTNTLRVLTEVFLRSNTGTDTVVMRR